MESFMRSITALWTPSAVEGQTMRAKLFALLAGLALLWFSLPAGADLTFVLTPAAQPGVGSNAIVFTGTLSNTSTANLLFLNNLQFSFIGTASNFLGPGANAFFANVPGILLPNETYSDIVFGLAINPATPPGDYFGSVTIQGGSNIFAGANLAAQMFLVSSADSVGDGIPDWWREQYFGGSGTTTNSQTCARCDADGTGQNNLYKYVAGLDPTNPASVFVLNISKPPPQPTLIFGPVAAGRTYTLQSRASLLGAVWSPLGGSTSPQTNSDQVSVTDLNAVGAQKYYRVQITLP